MLRLLVKLEQSYNLMLNGISIKHHIAIMGKLFPRDNLSSLKEKLLMDLKFSG